jgi:hypothetical protein
VRAKTGWLGIMATLRSESKDWLAPDHRSIKE